MKGYRTSETVSEYGEVNQRWILVESQERRKSDLEKLDKKLEQFRHKCHQDLQTLSGQDFACAADVIAAMTSYLKDVMAATRRCTNER